MERPRASLTLHELIEDAVERAASAHEHSAWLIEQQRDVVTDLRATLAIAGRRRRAFETGQPDDRRRSGPG